MPTRRPPCVGRLRCRPDFTVLNSFGLGTLMGRTTGEAFTMSFSGQGFVVVQPSEDVPASFVRGSGGGQQAGSAAGNILGGLLGR